MRNRKLTITKLTHRFGGIAIKNALPQPTGTLVAQTTMASCPVSSVGRIRGRAETFSSVDTDAEILALIGDYVLIDYNATGSSSGGPLYTIKNSASADTSGLEIVEGNAARGTLDVIVDARSYRHDVA